MEAIIIEKEEAFNTNGEFNIQKRIFQSKYLFILFLIFMILGSGYNIKINDIHERETKSTLINTSKSINKTLTAFAGNPSINYDFVNYFYKKLDYLPLWTEGFKQNHYAESLEKIIANSHNYGLRKNTQLIDEFSELKQKMTTTKSLDELSNLRAEYEIKLTDVALKTLIQLEKGIVYSDISRDNDVINNYSNFLLKSIQSENFEETFMGIQPENKIYNQLVNGLKLFLERATLSKEKVKIDTDDFEAIKKVSAQLFYELGYTDNTTDLDSVNFIALLKTFQKYHGINQTGMLCKKTIKALKMSSYERYEQIIINIERAKSDIVKGSTYVYVNIPAYNLKLYQNEELKVQHNVMVGKPGSQTPVLSSKIEFMVANPKWYVPKSISRGEILYRLKKDSTYLKKRNFVLLDKESKPVSQTDVNWNDISYRNFDYKLYQQPGRGNALGSIKFIFPNKYSVYLHDTQSKRLFNNDYRAYSHGCVRLENPLDFADHLLTHVDTDNLYKTIKPIVKSKKTKEVKFTKPINIHLRYYTCEVDGNNQIYFYQDIYGKDEFLKEKLFMN